MMKTISFQQLQRLRRGRAPIILIVALIALLSATVAIGQASQNFDLACRSILTGAGGTIAGGNFAAIGAFGLPMVPPKDSETAPTYAVRSPSFALRGGFLPGYPNGAGTVSATTMTVLPEQELVQRLPIIVKMLRIVRGGC
jgi:hypothetical protein